ncbi:hypothetical protein Y032_0388g507 [Ancylostoma ceylanicum]|uniref:Uncharacterized protein n=1 Tax=Ancylostoma ceylanicum TaxID=53326 RepID=A0A016RT25_9BILA|nr:hypothetical protein Y032_0388g507 [Ancylostoma ceylanicum]
MECAFVQINPSDFPILCYFQPTGNASDIACDFSAPLSPSRPQVIDSPGKLKAPAVEKPASVAKIGSTWAGASSLIDLDNLGSKNTPMKPGVSLNQMQLNKQCRLTSLF